jgi:hypothetical protein
MTSPARPILYVDHRKADDRHLPQLLAQELDRASDGALFWVAKRPRKRWFKSLTSWVPHVFSTGPLFEQILWLRPDLAVGPPESFDTEQKRLLTQYKTLFEGDTPVVECERWLSYKSLLIRHITSQETDTFPILERQLPVQRALRELGYEHRGLERGLDSMPAILQEARNARLSSQNRERFDLDFFHLLEHHLERETEAVYPAIVFLEGVDRKGSTCYNSPHRHDPT